MSQVAAVDSSALLDAQGLASGKKQAKPADAAKQFEALLIAQMLKSARDDGSGWLGSGEDESSEPAMALAEEHFAQALSAAGGLGIARVIEKSLQS